MRTARTSNSKEPQQKYRLGTVSLKILGGLNRFYGYPTSPSASIMAQNIQLFGPREGFLTHQWIILSVSYSNTLSQSDTGITILVLLRTSFPTALSSNRTGKYCLFFTVCHRSVNRHWRMLSSSESVQTHVRFRSFLRP